MTTYTLSIKPTESQLEYFLKQENLPIKDYWALLGKNKNVLQFHQAHAALTKLYGFLMKQMKNKLDELNINVLKYELYVPYLYYFVEIPNDYALQQISTLPEVRKIKESSELTPLDDEPQPPKNLEELNQWQPHSARYMKLSKHASEYLEKKEEESGNITYIYSDKHVKKRNKKKVKRIIQLGKSLKKLRAQVKKDLQDEELKPVAMVVALIDETYERVGNPASAKDNHFGVTTWRKKHVSFSKGKAKIKYKGKAGVDQEKTIQNSALVKDLKELLKDKKSNDELFPDVSANAVNDYLKSFKITAKDIRGFHANEEMKKALKSAKSGEKDKEKARKEKFKKALEETAKLVGHNPSTLKNQYLAPSIEKSYMETGKIQIKAFLLSSQLDPQDTKPIQEIPTSELSDVRDFLPEETIKSLNWDIIIYKPNSIVLKYDQSKLTSPAELTLNDELYLYFKPAVLNGRQIGPFGQEKYISLNDAVTRIKPLLSITDTEYQFAKDMPKDWDPSGF